MQTYLNILIADEYAAIQEIQKAVQLYNRSLMAYEKENWLPLADHLRERISALGLKK